MLYSANCIPINYHIKKRFGEVINLSVEFKELNKFNKKEYTAKTIVSISVPYSGNPTTKMC